MKLYLTNNNMQITGGGQRTVKVTTNSARWREKIPRRINRIKQGPNDKSSPGLEDANKSRNHYEADPHHRSTWLDGLCWRKLPRVDEVTSFLTHVSMIISDEILSFFGQPADVQWEIFSYLMLHGKCERFYLSIVMLLLMWTWERQTFTFTSYHSNLSGRPRFRGKNFIENLFIDYDAFNPSFQLASNITSRFKFNFLTKLLIQSN